MECDSRRVHLDLLEERVCQAGEAAHLHPHREVLALPRSWSKCASGQARQTPTLERSQDTPRVSNAARLRAKCHRSSPIARNRPGRNGTSRRRSRQVSGRELCVPLGSDGRRHEDRAVRDAPRPQRCDRARVISDLASRLRYRVQMTTDGHRLYLEAVESAFGAQSDYAMLIKLYGNADDPRSPERRYSPRAVSARFPPSSLAALNPSTSRHSSWNARTGPCGRRCVATRACRTGSAGRSTTTWPP